MCDMVPKTIMAFLVNKTKSMVQRELVANLYRDDVNLTDLLQEDNSTLKKREDCKKMVATLNEAVNYLNELRDFSFAAQQQSAGKSGDTI